MALAVHPQEQACGDDGAQADDGEDDERIGVVHLVAHGVAFQHLADEHGDEHQADVLDVIDDGVGGAQLLHRHDFGHCRPQGGGQQ